MDDRLIIRSYRRVFDIDRRLYRVDRWVLPVPGGVPLRGLAYFGVMLLLVLTLGRLPGVNALLGMLAPPLRYIVLPIGLAILGTNTRSDGRHAHRALLDYAGYMVRRARQKRYEGR